MSWKETKEGRNGDEKKNKEKKKKNNKKREDSCLHNKLSELFLVGLSQGTELGVRDCSLEQIGDVLKLFKKLVNNRRLPSAPVKILVPIDLFCDFEEGPL